jgi:PAS domain-containing protein
MIKLIFNPLQDAFWAGHRRRPGMMRATTIVAVCELHMWFADWWLAPDRKIVLIFFSGSGAWRHGCCQQQERVMTDTRKTGQAGASSKVLQAGIPERAKMLEALQESEDRYNRMLENLKEEFLFYRHDTSGRFTYISPSYSNILGFAPEEYIGMGACELWTPNPINAEADRSTKLSCQGIRQPP